MNKEDIAFRKLATLMKATNEANEQESLKELKAAAFEVLLFHPGCEQNDWANILVQQYATELTDAYGTNPETVYAALADLWDTPYFDSNSGIEYTYHVWAEALWTDAAVQMYYELTGRCLDND